jgi:hypothetical protein
LRSSHYFTINIMLVESKKGFCRHSSSTNKY